MLQSDVFSHICLMHKAFHMTCCHWMLMLLAFPFAVHQSEGLCHFWMLCSTWKLVSWSSQSQTHWALCECWSVLSPVCRGTKTYFTIPHWSDFPVLQQLTPILTLAQPSLDIWLFIQLHWCSGMHSQPCPCSSGC